MTALSIGATLAWNVAAAETAASRHRLIGREQLLIGICSLGKCLQDKSISLQPQARQALQAEHDELAAVFAGCGLDPTRLRRRVREMCGRGNCEHIGVASHRDEACKAASGRAEALKRQGVATDCLHLLAGLMQEPGPIVEQAMKDTGVKPAALERLLAAILRTPKPEAARHEAPEAPASGEGTTPFLDHFGRDLTLAAREGQLGPFVGRRQELLQIIQILARRSKNNPVLVGEAGVGKTAIVEALAMRITRGKDPQVLGGKRIIELNMGALVAGTAYRGQFEERIDQILREAISHPEIILFIDEIHTVVGAGRAEGTTDAANLLKPALARGKLRCIGATTIAEYRRHIESDTALERRFERVMIIEPSPEESLEILKGIRPAWEMHHGVQFADDALDAAVRLSVRFDSDHQLPDKAIDLVDRAGARTRVPILSMGAPSANRTATRDAASATLTRPVVNGLTIAEVLAAKMGLPLEVVTGYLHGMEGFRLRDLEPYLKSRLVGQTAAVEAVCQRLLLAHSGLTQRRGPLAVFLFLGPTGVGKTEMARQLTRFLFGAESEMIRLDMSEYKEPHNVARLVGSPPGYIGYESEGQLTGKLRSRPYCVVLLDEIEKAHPDVYDLFLQVFDDGRLTDAKGRTADASNAIFIMTSNIAVTGKWGFGQHETVAHAPALLDGLRKSFRAEFLNRIDDVVVFRGLDRDDILQILWPMLEEVCGTLARQHGITLNVTPDALEHLIQAGYSPAYGARELQRTVERLLQVPLSELLISGRLQKHSHWQVIHADGGLVVQPLVSGGETW